MGVIYRHRSINLTDFNGNYLNKLLRKSLKIKNPLSQRFSCSVDLLNYNKHNPTNEFLDSLASDSFIPSILQTTRISSHSNTPIDNIF